MGFRHSVFGVSRPFKEIGVGDIGIITLGLRNQELSLEFLRFGDKALGWGSGWRGCRASDCGVQKRKG